MARALNDPEDHDAPFAPGSKFHLTTSLHSHNGYLQIWYEAGAVGAVFLLGLGLMVLRSAGRAPMQAQPNLHAIFVACALLGGSSFSLWQPWFMASFGFVAAWAMVGRTLAGRSLPSGTISACGIARS
jgi:O-antigen ligase